MSSVIGAFKEVLSKSFDLRFWLYVIIAIILLLVGIAVVSLVFFFIGIIFFLIFGLSIPGILIYILLGVIWYVAVALVSVLMGGMIYTIARGHFEGKKVSLEEAYAKARPRVWDMLKIEIIFGIIVWAIMVIFVLPGMLGLLGAFSGPALTQGIACVQSIATTQPQLTEEAIATCFAGTFSDPTTIIAPLFSMMAGLLVSLLVIIIISPFLMLALSVPLFEKKGARASLGRIFELGKKNYFFNLLSIILMVIVVIIADILREVIVWPFMIISPVLGAAVFLVLFIIILLWQMAFSYLYMVKIYLANTGSEAKK